MQILKDVVSSGGDQVDNVEDGKLSPPNPVVMRV